jgi:acetylornithine deacetylase
LLFVSGEERDSAGAKAANKTPKGSRFLINGEPTDNRLALASKGALRAAFKSTGKMAHSAYPELGESAFTSWSRCWERCWRMPLPELEASAPARSTSARFTAATRPTSSPTRPRRRCWCARSPTRPRCAPRSSEIAGDQAEVEFTLDTPFVRLRAVEGLPTMVAKFSTDIPHLSNWGEPLLLGPGSIHVAHTPQ